MRLIDADALGVGRCSKDILPAAYCAGWNGLIELIEKAPTIDAVPVVRCRECKWWQEDDDIGHCDNPDGLDNYAKPEDFCSYGKRKGGADNR